MEVLLSFCIGGQVLRVKEYGEGHINASYRVEMSDGGVYLLQQINTRIFPRPDLLMENISKVTDYLREQILLRGGDPERETLRAIPARSGALYEQDEESRL